MARSGRDRREVQSGEWEHRIVVVVEPASSCSASSSRPWRRRRSASRHRALLPHGDPVGQQVERADELVFGVLPAPGGDEDARVVRPAVPRHRDAGCPAA